jgi:hypothetical protein
MFGEIPSLDRILTYLIPLAVIGLVSIVALVIWLVYWLVTRSGII